MNKYTCTTSRWSTTYFVVTVARDRWHPLEIARVKALQEWGPAVSTRDWNAQYVDSGYGPPARILDFGIT